MRFFRPARPAPLAALRRAYAEELAADVGVRERTLVEAFASVPREDFLGPGPWWIVGEHHLGMTPDDDPSHLYKDVLVAIDRARGINNGEPALHMMSMAELAPTPRERVAHVGCGTGYYTAILAEMVGPDGRVEAFEAEKDIEARARDGLAPWPQVTVQGAAGPGTLHGPLDGVYASAAATSPRTEWLDAIVESGRIVFPLSDASGRGVMLRLEKQGDTFAARVFSRAAFIPMQGGIDHGEGAAVSRAAAAGLLRKARWFRRGPPQAGDMVVVEWPVGCLVG